MDHPLIPPCTPQVSRGREANGRWRIHRCLSSGRRPFWCAACWLSEPSGYESVSDWAHPSWCPALWAQSQRDSLGAGRHQHSSAKLEHVWMVPTSSRVKNVHESLNGTHLVGRHSRVWLVASVFSSCSPPKKQFVAASCPVNMPSSQKNNSISMKPYWYLWHCQETERRQWRWKDRTLGRDEKHLQWWEAAVMFVFLL